MFTSTLHSIIDRFSKSDGTSRPNASSPAEAAKSALQVDLHFFWDASGTPVKCTIVRRAVQLDVSFVPGGFVLS